MVDIRFWNKIKREKESFIDIIKRIKDGDILLRNKFISDYKPFILKSVSQVTGNKKDVESSEVFSIALIAFNEALECYDASKNRLFTDFSKQVIKRRIIDYMRSSQKASNILPFSYFNDSGNYDFEEKYLKDTYSDHTIDFEIKEEFCSFEKKISEFKMTVEDLITCSPKHRDTRAACLKIAKIVADDDILFKKLMDKKSLPFSELVKRVDLCQRSIERNRKFIIAMVIVLKSDLEVLKNYIIHSIGR
ncbi:MAG: RNA polymerase sigma-I factor [Bacillota bacterium]|nr:RNA polymerase sigma-I factor [Bacillota bacterium]